MIELKPGIKGTATAAVTPRNTAQAMGSGTLPVFATPAMCALMEEAACTAVSGCLDEASGTVGISLNITHDAPSAIGQTITATAVLKSVEGRKLNFEVTAQDDDGKTIGKGLHSRFIINNEKFMSKLQK